MAQHEGAVPARAKVNLFLHVGDKDADFHPLQSLVVFAEAGDTLSAGAGEGLTLAVEGPQAGALAAEADNLVLKAARALAAQAGREPRAHLVLDKVLPVASGIGGGSADAAAALRALRALWQLEIDEAGLRALAAELGSDVPVCVAGVPAFMEGRGEIITPLQSLPRMPLLLVNPGAAVPTRDVFAALESRSGVGLTLPPGRFQDSADLLRFLETTRNDLEAPARALQPVIGDVLAALAALPGALFVRMSGSGATCFAIFPDDEGCARAGAMLKDKNPGWWIAPTVVPELAMLHETIGQDIGPNESGL